MQRSSPTELARTLEAAGDFLTTLLQINQSPYPVEEMPIVLTAFTDSFRTILSRQHIEMSAGQTVCSFLASLPDFALSSPSPWRPSTVGIFESF